MLAPRGARHQKCAHRCARARACIKQRQCAYARAAHGMAKASASGIEIIDA